MKVHLVFAPQPLPVNPVDSSTIFFLVDPEHIISCEHLANHFSPADFLEPEDVPCFAQDFETKVAALNRYIGSLDPAKSREERRFLEFTAYELQYLLCQCVEMVRVLTRLRARFDGIEFVLEGRPPLEENEWAHYSCPAFAWYDVARLVFPGAHLVSGPSSGEGPPVPRRRSWRHGLRELVRRLVNLAVGNFTYLRYAIGTSPAVVVDEWNPDARLALRSCVPDGISTFYLPRLLESGLATVLDLIHRHVSGSGLRHSLERGMEQFLRRGPPEVFLQDGIDIRTLLGRRLKHSLNSWFTGYRRRIASARLLSVVGRRKRAYLHSHTSGHNILPFRDAGFRIFNYQHGFNMEFQVFAPCRDWSLNDVVFTYSARIDLSRDLERRTASYHPKTWVPVGSVRLGRLRRRIRTPFRLEVLEGQFRLLYVPTVMSIRQPPVIGLPEYSYVPLYLSILETLSLARRCRVTVKIFPHGPGVESHVARVPESDRLRYVQAGVVSDYLDDADVFLIDSAVGTPIIEALTTDRPILLYTGGEHLILEAEALERLRRRCRLFDEASEYLQGLRSFLDHPRDFVEGVDLSDDSFLRAYGCPVEPEAFVKALAEVLVSETD